MEYGTMSESSVYDSMTGSQQSFEEGQQEYNNRSWGSGSGGALGGASMTDSTPQGGYYNR